MLRTYFKVAARQLWKNKFFTGIKVTSLTIGLTACLLIGLYIHHESSFDKFHEKGDQIYRTVMHYVYEGEEDMVEVTGNKVVPALTENIAGIEKGTRVIKYEDVISFNELKFEEENIYYADSTFFDIFSFPIVKSNIKDVLTRPNQVLMTSSVSEKYFGSSDPLGKMIKIGSREYEVVGIMADVPENSQLRPDFVASFYSLRSAEPDRETWWNANYASYFLLHPSQSFSEVNGRISAYMDEVSGETGMQAPNLLNYILEPLADVHLHSEVAGNFVPNGDLRYLKILSIIAILILLIACSIYINLTNALGSERAREVGVQKVLGASQRQLFMQYMGESLVITAASMILAMMLLISLLPYFNQFFKTSISKLTLANPMFIGVSILTWLVLSLAAGCYPTLLITRVKTTKVLKGQYRLSPLGIVMRKSMVIFQFAIAIGLIISTVILNGQLHYIQNKKLGLNTSMVVVLPTDRQVIDELPALKTSITKFPGLESVSLVYETPSKIDGTYNMSNLSQGGEKFVKALPVDDQFIPTMDIPVLSGKNFTKNDVTSSGDFQNDSTILRKIIVNEALCSNFQWSPAEAEGKIINFNSNRSQIVGVVRDFHFSSLHENITPLILFPDTWGNQILVRISGSDVNQNIADLESAWNTVITHRPFGFHFLEEEYDEMYQSEMRTSSLVTIFSILSLFLASMGLVGLTSILIAQRTKEIGIRKVLGSTTMGIVKLLSKSFIILIGIAFLIISPLVFHIMQNWLDNFIFHIDIGIWVFLIAGFSVMFIAIFILGSQGLKASLQNPIESLRSE